MYMYYVIFVYRSLMMRERVFGVLSEQHYHILLHGEWQFTAHCSMPCSLCRLLPVVIVMLPFTLVVEGTGLLDIVDDCSCWCPPTLGNIMPYANRGDNVSPILHDFVYL